MIDTKLVKKDKGHDVFVNGQWVMWVIGSAKNASKELEKYLKEEY